MKGFAKKQGGIGVSPVDLDDATGSVTCEVSDCFGMAMQRITMAGYPAGHVCSKHARDWLKLWREFTAEDNEPMEMAA